MEEQRSGSGRRKNAAYVIIAIATSILVASLMAYALKNNQYLYFNGHEYLLVNKSVQGNFTVSAWLYYAHFNGTGVAVSEGIGENEHSIWYMGTGGEVPNVTSCGVFSDELLPGNFTAGWRFASVPFIGTGRWFNIACAFNTTNLSIYVDGRLMNTVATPYKVYGGRIIEVGKRTSTFYLNGNTPTFAYFNGYIANLQIYNTTLNPGNINLLYKQGIKGRPLPGVAIYMPMSGSNYSMLTANP
ncbi:MAG: LamG domain-containing protein [Candidatus Micrarchaeaceae archaeon]